MSTALRAGRREIEERFWAKVDYDPHDPARCWEWQAWKRNGYGQFELAGMQVNAHRLAYELEVGPIPEGLIIDHLCRNRACVNPAHLEPVTYAENAARGLLSYALRDRCRSGQHDITDPKNVWTAPSTGARRCRPCMRAQGNARQARARARAQEPEEAGREAARSLPPLTDAEAADVAALLSLPSVRERAAS